MTLNDANIGEEYIIPTLGVWDSFDEIDFDSLPDSFVLKCTHDSGGLVIVKDKSQLDKEQAKQKIEKCLKRNFYYSGREWPYKNVKPRVIAETFMENDNGEPLRDYKFYCFKIIHWYFFSVLFYRTLSQPSVVLRYLLFLFLPWEYLLPFP